MSDELLYRKRCKRLSLALGLSAFLNISILAFGIYEWQETGFSFLATSSFRPQKSKLYRQQGKELATLTKTFRELEALDYAALLNALDDQSVVGVGYKRQDLALSMLGKKHYFDVKRALGRDVAVKRLFTYMAQDGVSCEVILYPELQDLQHAQVLEFAKKEKWPFTTQGLFVKYKETQDPELRDLIQLSDEYMALQILLTRGTSISRDAIFDFAMNLDYTFIKNLYDEMAKSQDFSPEVRRGFLLRALPHSSALLFQLDPRFSVHSLRDTEVLMLLQELTKKPELATDYALALLETPRSNAIWQKAMLVLCERKQLDPQKETRDSLLQHFGRIAPKPAAKPVSKPITTQAPKPQSVKPLAPKVTKPQKAEIVYIVQAGDTLWHISKRFSVDIDKLKKHNKLTTDALKPGTMLRIPQEPKSISKAK